MVGESGVNEHHPGLYGDLYQRIVVVEIAPVRLRPDLQPEVYVLDQQRHILDAVGQHDEAGDGGADDLEPDKGLVEGGIDKVLLGRVGVGDKHYVLGDDDGKVDIGDHVEVFGEEGHEIDPVEGAVEFYLVLVVEQETTRLPEDALQLQLHRHEVYALYELLVDVLVGRALRPHHEVHHQ